MERDGSNPIRPGHTYVHLLVHAVLNYSVPFMYPSVLFLFFMESTFYTPSLNVQVRGSLPDPSHDGRSSPGGPSASPRLGIHVIGHVDSLFSHFLHPVEIFSS